ncbi:MAG: Phosphatidyl-N-methylethanolamine N-methyltransferase [Chaenotheca gracillima]|nr:MAG: Phosphatidyl-N-methylethanolamine N-methyltransferase [Chaenotheca gracillima]
MGRRLSEIHNKLDIVDNVNVASIRKYDILIQLIDKQEVENMMNEIRRVIDILSDSPRLEVLNIMLQTPQDGQNYDGILRPFATLRRVERVFMSGITDARFSVALEAQMKSDRPFDHLPNMLWALREYALRTGSWEIELRLATDAVHYMDAHAFQIVRAYLLEKISALDVALRERIYAYDTIVEY